jgi:hypothetical protein
MSIYCLFNAFRRNSGPVLFLFTLCLVLGGLFSTLGAEIGSVLILSGSAALILFMLLGARKGCRPTL